MRGMRIPIAVQPLASAAFDIDREGLRQGCRCSCCCICYARERTCKYMSDVAITEMFSEISGLAHTPLG